VIFGTEEVTNFSQIRGERWNSNVASYWAVSVLFLLFPGVVLALIFSHDYAELQNSRGFFLPLTWLYVLAYCVGHDCVAKLTGLGAHPGLGELYP